MKPLRLGVESWMITDGLYDDFVAGMETRFAVAMTPRLIQEGESGIASATSLGGCFHLLQGVVSYAQRGVWILETSFPIFCEGNLPQSARTGTWLSVEAALHLDPGNYHRVYSRRLTMPPLTRPYRIRSIRRDTTLWRAWTRAENRPIRAGGRSEHLTEFLARESGRHNEVDVKRTRADIDDGGSAHYTLACLPVNEGED